MTGLDIWIGNQGMSCNDGDGLLFVSLSHVSSQSLKPISLSCLFLPYLVLCLALFPVTSVLLSPNLSTPLFLLLSSQIISREKHFPGFIPVSIVIHHWVCSVCVYVCVCVCLGGWGVSYWCLCIIPMCVPLVPVCLCVLCLQWCVTNLKAGSTFPL